MKAVHVDGYPDNEWLIWLDDNPWWHRIEVYRVDGTAQRYGSIEEAGAVIADLESRGKTQPSKLSGSVSHDHEYCVYDGLREKALAMWRDVLNSGRHDGLFLVATESGRTVDLSFTHKPPNKNMPIEYAPAQDVKKVLCEAFCGLTKDEMERYVKDLDTVRIIEYGVRHWNISDLADKWRKAPQRGIERAEEKARRAKQRRQSWAKATTWLRSTFWGRVVAILGFVAALFTIAMGIDWLIKVFKSMSSQP